MTDIVSFGLQGPPSHLDEKPYTQHLTAPKTAATRRAQRARVKAQQEKARVERHRRRLMARHVRYMADYESARDAAVAHLEAAAKAEAECYAAGDVS